MENINLLKNDKDFNRIISDFNFKKFKKINIQDEFKDIFLEIYLLENKNKEIYYLIKCKKNSLTTIEKIGLPILMFYYSDMYDMCLCADSAKKILE